MTASKKSRMNRSEAQLAPKPSGKLSTMVEMLQRSEGASIGQLVEMTGWKPHSVRGALAGSLKKKGHTITSAAVEGVRRYRITVARA